MNGKHIVARTADAWNTRDQEGFVGLYTDDCELSAPGWAGKGREGLLEFWSLYMTAFPDNRITVRTLIEDTGGVAEEGVLEGTHTGPMPAPDGTEIPPTGRRLSGPYLCAHHLVGDRISASRFYFDQMDLLDQLGLAGA
jgi:uncharacterized protein (TIGR02246 family)